ncbi:MAG: hypothetical protein A2Y10_10820 [Planctomycetes bacterium GWF2_41_51]|nr:MAG: hypothetical protein A2Y10_10820 [Planctomycetes bacterium GWF2_41_51]HBG28462.1 hypothetical protein [Phycisphaerales bacterium]
MATANSIIKEHPAKYFRKPTVIVLIIISLFLCTQIKSENSTAIKEEKKLNAAKAAAVNVPKDPNDPNNWPFMEIYVADNKTEEPLKDVRVTGSTDKKKIITTDANGYCKVTLDKNKSKDYFSIYIEKEGFVPMSGYWGKQYQRTVPKELEFFLERATIIGGLVTDEQNLPVQDAKVTIDYYVNDEDEINPVQRINDFTINTDINGKWQCDLVPAVLHEYSQIGIKIKHKNYAHYQTWTSQSETIISQLRKKEFVSVLKKGAAVYGYILDSANRPIKDVSVSIGEGRYSSDNLKTMTDAAGYYEFPNAKKGFNILKVAAKNYAPDLKELNVKESAQEENFILLPGNTIRGRIVDVNGNPIVKASVRTDEWRCDGLDWNGNTDNDGRFVWNDAPSDEVKFGFHAKNYMGQNKVLSPSEKEYEIILSPQLVVFGNVLDDTNGLIMEGKITAGTIWNSGERLIWQNGSHWQRNIKDGTYEMPLTSPAYAYTLRLDLPDGRQTVSRTFDTNEGRVKYDFILSKTEDATKLRGVVYNPDGKAAEGVQVYLVKKDRYLNLENGKQRHRQDIDKSITDLQGRFSLPDCNDKFKLVAVSEEGYADVNNNEFALDPNIYLEKWGRVEGVVYVGSKPAANEEIIASYSQNYDSRDGIYYNCMNRAVTDQQGQFVMDKIAPGRNQISRIMKSDDDSQNTGTVSQHIEVVSGETVEIVLGGTGRAVTGKIIWPADELFTKTLWIYAHLQRKQSENPLAVMETIYSQVGEMPIPANFDSLTAKQCIEWYQNWSQSEEGKAYSAKIKAAMQKSHPQISESSQRGGVIVNSDGSFRAEDVEEGSYTLRIMINEKKGRYGAPNVENQVIGKVEFTMPPIDISNIDLPLDTGQMPMQIVSGKQLLQTDSNASDFTIETNAGIIKLSDLQGKIVVLVFWDALFTLSNSDSETKINDIFETYKKYAGANTIEFIGISGKSIKSYQEISAKYLRENSCNWKQAYIRYDNPIFENYRYQYGINAVVIGPDGKIIEAGIDGKRLGELLEKIK